MVIEILQFIAFLIVSSLWIWGIHGFFQLTGFSDSFNWLPSWITKPLWDCPPCESSVHGTAIFFIFTNFDFMLWPVFCICLCGLNYIIKEHLYV